LASAISRASQPRELGVGQEPNRHAARYPRLPVPDKTVAGWRPLKEAGTDDPDRACWRSSCTATWRPDDDPEKSNS
ncbi:hypothetical protein, partial [Mycobacterium sp.]|uniref:hypothetical protein n=1 Tax=Mycobacterium sp. TaxID=1785 RepID=UPI003C74380A